MIKVSSILTQTCCYNNLLYLLHTIFKANKDRFFNNFRQLFYFLFFMIIFQYTLGIIILKIICTYFVRFNASNRRILILSLLVISLCEAKKMGRKRPIKNLKKFFRIKNLLIQIQQRGHHQLLCLHLHQFQHNQLLLYTEHPNQDQKRC